MACTSCRHRCRPCFWKFDQRTDCSYLGRITSVGSTASTSAVRFCLFISWDDTHYAVAAAGAAAVTSATAPLSHTHPHSWPCLLKFSAAWPAVWLRGRGPGPAAHVPVVKREATTPQLRTFAVIHIKEEGLCTTHDEWRQPRLRSASLQYSTGRLTGRTVI